MSSPVLFSCRQEYGPQDALQARRTRQRRSCCRVKQERQSISPNVQLAASGSAAVQVTHRRKSCEPTSSSSPPFTPTWLPHRSRPAMTTRCSARTPTRCARQHRALLEQFMATCESHVACCEERLYRAFPSCEGGGATCPRLAMHVRRGTRWRRSPTCIMLVSISPGDALRAVPTQDHQGVCPLAALRVA